ncbi:hypothetical protein SELMODRAFT_409849 [Selaginella moellendorffii]|uniref:Uncharacterized protein n=1 Tax=Selaginella moellendorffii TaxID=88036 RepID=D8RCN2_SELML|nr:hypothetical protein SELMODRAFT_409849 [Selaginella moellendorffii]
MAVPHLWPTTYASGSDEIFPALTTKTFMKVESIGNVEIIGWDKKPSPMEWFTVQQRIVKPMVASCDIHPAEVSRCKTRIPCCIVHQASFLAHLHQLLLELKDLGFGLLDHFAYFVDSLLKACIIWAVAKDDTEIVVEALDFHFVSEGEENMISHCVDKCYNIWRFKKTVPLQSN